MGWCHLLHDANDVPDDQHAPPATKRKKKDEEEEDEDENVNDLKYEFSGYIYPRPPFTTWPTVAI
uniref:Uncharacterized protein, isoform C n=1 Tax=Drosophila pseudoobscura pseudoobscura TaxID=46245 RepID=A0A0R3P0R6_DROPS